MHNILVVMPYTEPWSDRVWDALRQISVKDAKKRLNVNRADGQTASADLLQYHIEMINRGSQIIIADITGQNPNVLIEVGIALALGTPMLLIVQDRKDVPTHLKGWIVDQYYQSDESLEFTANNLLLRIDEKLKLMDAQRQESARYSSYRIQCYANRSIAALHKYFRDAQYRIDILTTNLAFLFEEYGPEPRTYFDEIQVALDRASSRTKIRILTLDPESDFAAKRGKQLGYAPQVFRDNLRNSLSKTLSIGSKYPKERFEVRQYDDFPNQIMYRVDDNIFNSVVAQPTASRRHLTFMLDRHQAGVESSFTEHFQYIWSKVT